VARHEVHVDLPRERAFELFTEELGAWWPPDYSWSGEVLEEIGIEPGAGGLCYERGPHGFRCDWGRVLAWEPPGRLTLAWQISPRREPEPNPARASEVDVLFTDTDGGTSVSLEHRAFDRHGEEGEQYAEMLDSREGWPLILGRYAAVAAESV
jgi:uncharacterized protein YndB with AHSA1/START domain